VADDTEAARPRWLLDQNFPPAQLDAQRLDRGVEYVNLRTAFPDPAAQSTPDWQLYLAAACGGFAGLVTSDASQVEQDTELIALTISRINVITWRGGQADPVALWGQLLAYMPLVQERVDPARPYVFWLPTPRLAHGPGFRTPGDLARERKKRDGVSYQERRGAEVATMKRMLSGVPNRDDWLRLLDAEPSRRGFGPE
jgi:hypothetical protein